MADEKKAPQCQYKSTLVGYTVHGTPILQSTRINQYRESLAVIGTRLDDAIRRR